MYRHDVITCRNDNVNSIDVSIRQVRRYTDRRHPRTRRRESRSRQVLGPFVPNPAKPDPSSLASPRSFVPEYAPILASASCIILQGFLFHCHLPPPPRAIRRPSIDDRRRGVALTATTNNARDYLVSNHTITLLTV